MSLRVCKVPGSKWTHAEWIVSHYVRPRAEWRECRGNADVADELEKARWFLVEGWQSHGARTGSRSAWRRAGKDNGRRGRSFAQEWADLPARIMAAAERMRGVHIEHRPALQLLRTYRGPEALVYLDPPYPAETSQGVRDVLYKHEMMTAEQHIELLTEAMLHPGPLLLSSYRNDLYDGVLLGSGWEVAERAARGEHGVERVEALYLNPVALAEQARVWQLDLLGGESPSGSAAAVRGPARRGPARTSTRRSRSSAGRS